MISCTQSIGNPDDPVEPFNMAYLALRGSGAANAVSRLHAQVSRRIFQPLFPRWPEEEVPIGYVTNGVHMPSWDSGVSEDLWTEACGRDLWHGALERVEEDIRKVPDQRLWQNRAAARRELVHYIRDRFSRQLEASGASSEACTAASRIFDPEILTLGFARRFATYKRPTLLLHDPARLKRMLTDPQRPVQLVIAGKAHPADAPGQAMIRAWMQFIRGSGARRHVVFLSDYDMSLTEHLVRGVDVWLNTPRRPWEASGTSGMKVLVNGGINLSELDGWWAEAYSPEVGWALGDGKEHGGDPAWDEAEAEQLYRLLENEVIPDFYTRDANGIPARWIARMHESMARLTPRFSANRTVREYTEKYYLPAARTYRERAANKGAMGVQLTRWKREIERDWPDEDESVADVFYRDKPDRHAPELAPDDHGLIWLPEEAFAAAFAPNATPEEQAVLAAVQRLISPACISVPMAHPRWKNLPAWYLVSEEDRMIPRQRQEFMAERMRARRISHPVDHTPSVTAPHFVTEVILQAVHSIDG